VKIITSIWKAVANRHLYNQQTNTKHRSLNVYCTLTLQELQTRSANWSISQHKWSKLPTWRRQLPTAESLRNTGVFNLNYRYTSVGKIWRCASTHHI